VPVWRTSDSVWVVSHDSTTGRVFDKNLDIRASAGTELPKLLTKIGHLPMARLVNDILIPYDSTRILFIDNKAYAHSHAFFSLLDSYAGNTRYVSKAYDTSKNTATEAHKRGYVTRYYMTVTWVSSRRLNPRLPSTGSASAA
jgi:glycerophosphoryl diester phosphodiesterase